MEPWVAILLIVLALAIGAVVAWFIAYNRGKQVVENKFERLGKEANKIIEDAEKEGQAQKKDLIIEAKKEIAEAKKAFEVLKKNFEAEVNEKKAELQEETRKLDRREANLENRSTNLDKRESGVIDKENKLEQRIAEVEKRNNKIEELINEQEQKLMEIAGLNQEQARDIVFKRLEEDMSKEMAIYIKEETEKAQSEASHKSQTILANAIHQYANETVQEKTVSVVALPNDEMKGRIIGREGRNIRTLETLTGVELIIDDTPEAVVLSGFDPIRREIARIALEKLILDGRIHPARIEEMVEKAQKEVETLIKEEGEAATLEVGVHGIHPELVRLLGKLRYRTSYGQNVLKHSIEVAQITGLLASELGLDVKMAKRAGLLHDIGKAVDHEMEGSHIQLGVDLCRRYKESALVINAVEAHHGDVEPESLIACLVQAADTISAARPGARRETLETYTNRLKQLEDITNSYKGVEKSFAIQAGREVRVMVVPEVISDSDMVLLARDISKQIENQMEYPGQIKVSIVRESRAVDYAK